MGYLSYLANWLYIYCTDFIINVFNVTKLSYFEVNALIFCIIWPALTVVLILIYMSQKIKLNYRKYRKPLDHN